MVGTPFIIETLFSFKVFPYIKCLVSDEYNFGAHVIGVIHRGGDSRLSISRLVVCICSSDDAVAWVGGVYVRCGSSQMGSTFWFMSLWSGGEYWWEVAPPSQRSHQTTQIASLNFVNAIKDCELFLGHVDSISRLFYPLLGLAFSIKAGLFSFVEDQRWNLCL